MEPLYQKHGGPPQPLPKEDRLPDGTIFTNLANEPASRALLGWVEAPAVVAIPSEIPMHKARKALRMRGPAGEVFDQDDVSWMELVEQAIANIPDKVQRGSVRDELDTAPNMVLGGQAVQMIRAAIGMTQEQLEDVARLALTLP